MELGRKPGNIGLSVVIPVYNKESVIELTLIKSIDFLCTQGYEWEIIVIDDGSNDNTLAVIKQFMASHKDLRLKLLINNRNQKKGMAIRRGINIADGEYVIFVDADYAYPINQVGNFLRHLRNGAEVVIGNRVDPNTTYLVKPSCFNYIYRRYLIGRVFNLVVRMLLLVGISDTQCGIKGFRTETAKAIFQNLTIPDFAFDVEILYIAQQNNKAIVQIPVTYDYIDEPSSVQLFKDSFVMIRSLFKIKYNGWRKRYSLSLETDGKQVRNKS